MFKPQKISGFKLQKVMFCDSTCERGFDDFRGYKFALQLIKPMRRRILM